MCSKLGQFELKGPLFATMVLPMKEKLRKYFQKASPVITCAAALNPCFNVRGVKLLIEKIALDLDLDLDSRRPFLCNQCEILFQQMFKDLFDVYYNIYGQTNVSTSSASSSLSTNATLDM